MGVDRPGIVADVTRIVTAKGGNVGESHSQLLGGHFSLTMLVEVSSAEMDGLRVQLQKEVEGMSTSFFDAVDPKKVEIHPKVGCECQYPIVVIFSSLLMFQQAPIFILP